MIFEAILYEETLKFKCTSCDYSSKMLTNVLKHCGSTHCNFDNCILISPSWVFSNYCSDILEYMKHKGLVCEPCQKVFTTCQSYHQHKKSLCQKFDDIRQPVSTTDSCTQTDTEYMLLEEEVIILRRECRNAARGTHATTLLDL